jgi:hypothetical protein
MAITRSPRRALAVAFVVLAITGCAHRVPVAAPGAPKPEIGRLAISVQGTASGDFQRPGVVGAREGAKVGALVGAVVPFYPGLAVGVFGVDARDPNALIVALMALGAGAVLAPVSAAVGAAVGAIAAPSREAVERSASALERALAEADLAEALVREIVAAAPERPIVVGDYPDGLAVDAFLEVESQQVRLASGSPRDGNADLTFTLDVRARLVRATDGEALRTYSWSHEGPRAAFVEWGRDDARRFRGELERAVRALSVVIVADLF